jgi:hypothetical protein
MELELDPLREEILDLLRNGICEITFKKVNGDERVMPCTLKAELLPEAKQKEPISETVRERKGDAVSVWCTDARAWRSFKLENFISIRKIND